MALFGGGKPSCLFCDWLFLNLEAFTEIHPGLGFDLLTQTTRALEPLQTNGLLVWLLSHEGPQTER